MRRTWESPCRRTRTSRLTDTRSPCRRPVARPSLRGLQHAASPSDDLDDCASGLARHALGQAHVKELVQALALLRELDEDDDRAQFRTADGTTTTLVNMEGPAVARVAGSEVRYSSRCSLTSGSTDIMTRCDGRTAEIDIKPGCGWVGRRVPGREPRASDGRRAVASLPLAFGR